MIKGKLVGLRAVEKEDLKLLRDWRNLESFRKYFREFRELNMANQEQWFNKCCIANPNDFMFIIQRLDSKAAIGACGLLYVDWIIRSADFSLYIGEEEKYIDNNGFAKEAVNLLIRYGFNVLNINKIWMELFEFDKLKLDFFQNIFFFKIDGKLRQNCFYDGKYWDSYIISLLKTDYNK